MMREIDHIRDAEAAGLKFLDNVTPALGSPARREHWIQNNRAVVMKRHPVVWKDRIRRMKLFHVFHENDFDASFSQSAGKHVELYAGTALDVSTAGFGRLSLKEDSARSFGIEAE
jgi:hypothetical protein